MAANGSPPPMFETDDDRTYFVNRLPVHDGARGGWSPEVTPEVTPEVPPQFAAFVDRLLAVLEGEMSRQQLQAALQLKDDKHFREAFLQPALVARLVVMTQPDHPRSSKQRYRLTAEGRLRRSQLDAAR